MLIRTILYTVAVVVGIVLFLFLEDTTWGFIGCLLPCYAWYITLNKKQWTAPIKFNPSWRGCATTIAIYCVMGLVIWLAFTTKIPKYVWKNIFVLAGVYGISAQWWAYRKSTQATDTVPPTLEAEDAERQVQDSEERQTDEAMKVSGTVVAFHRSPDGEIDGIELNDGTEVRFPPRSGEIVAASVSIGDQVEIVGRMQDGEFEIHATTVTSVGSGKSVEVDKPPADLPE